MDWKQELGRKDFFFLPKVKKQSEENIDGKHEKENPPECSQNRVTE